MKVRIHRLDPTIPLPAYQTAGAAAWNVLVHVLMLAGVTALLLVPDLERWVNHHVMSG